MAAPTIITILAVLTAMSADGNVLVGYLNDSSHAIAWTEGDGLFNLDGGIAAAKGVNHDGSVIVGNDASGNLSRWQNFGAIENLGVPTNGDLQGINVSPDGLVVVFGGRDLDIQPFTMPGMFTDGGGFVFLETTVVGNANRASFDGSVIVGNYGDSPSPAFRWTSGGFVGIGTLLGDNYAEAYSVSDDGNTIVGISSSDTADHAFRWTPGEGMVDMGTIDSSTSIWATGCSADGSIIIGIVETGSGERAWTWTASGGFQVLDILPGTIDAQALVISGDGTKVLGHIYDGSDQLYVVWNLAPGQYDVIGEDADVTGTFLEGFTKDVVEPLVYEE